MANHEDDGSLAQELWKAIHPFMYRGIVPYIGKNTAVKIKEFDQHYLNENCDCCAYKSRDVRNLQKHVIKHTKKLPHVCDQCGKGFCWYQQLKCHVGKKECSPE